MSAQTCQPTRAEVLGDLAKATSDATLRREELTKATSRPGLRELLSPVHGTVTGLTAHTIGGVVEPTKPVMVIVPTGSNLVIEARLSNRERGFVQIGQEVAVKLEAFPFTRFGTVPGTIMSIGSDAVEDEKLGLVYPVRVKLLRATMLRGDGVAPVTPGMVATADIMTGRRSIMSYLVSPIDEVTVTGGYGDSLLNSLMRYALGRGDSQ